MCIWGGAAEVQIYILRHLEALAARWREKVPIQPYSLLHFEDVCIDDSQANCRLPKRCGSSWPRKPVAKWWHPLIGSLLTTLGAHVGQESCRAFSEQGPPTTSIVWPLPREVLASCWSVWRPCGLHLSCSRWLCPWQLARRLQVMMGYEGYDNSWTLNVGYFLNCDISSTPRMISLSLAPLSYLNYIQKIYPLKSRSLSTLTNYTP